MSKFDALKKVLTWCKDNPHRDTFFYYDVGVHQRTLASLSDVPYKNQVWITTKGVHEPKDCNHGLVKYALSKHVIN